MKTTRLILISAAIAAFAACKKIEQLPPEPQIEYKEFKIFDTTDILGNKAKGGRLKFRFQDGDGDMGMYQPTGEETDTSNLMITLYRRKNGILIPSDQSDPLFPSNYRIPYMERQGQNKILKGTITVTFLYLFYSPADTIRYEFYIKDRALNESNTVTTNDIIIAVNGTY